MRRAPHLGRILPATHLAGSDGGRCHAQGDANFNFCRLDAGCGSPAVLVPLHSSVAPGQSSCGGCNCASADSSLSSGAQACLICLPRTAAAYQCHAEAPLAGTRDGGAGARADAHRNFIQVGLAGLQQHGARSVQLWRLRSYKQRPSSLANRRTDAWFSQRFKRSRRSATGAPPPERTHHAHQALPLWDNACIGCSRCGQRLLEGPAGVVGVPHADARLDAGGIPRGSSEADGGLLAARGASQRDGRRGACSGAARRREAVKRHMRVPWRQQFSCCRRSMVAGRCPSRAQNPTGLLDPRPRGMVFLYLFPGIPIPPQGTACRTRGHRLLPQGRRRVSVGVLARHYRLPLVAGQRGVPKILRPIDQGIGPAPVGAW